MARMSPQPRSHLSRPLLAGAVLALLPACLKPGPRIPFDHGRGYMVLATASQRWLNDRYVHGYVPYGIEVVSMTPGSAGWGWEFSAHLGEDTGEDKERKVFRPTFDNGNGGTRTIKYNVSVPTERTTEFYEVSAGVRQAFFLDSRVQPYFGVGGTVFYLYERDIMAGTFELTDPNPPNDTATVTAVNESEREWNFGIYMRTGLAWRLFGDPEGKRIGTFFTTDLRGMLGTYFSSVEFVFGFGFGR